MSLTNNFIYFIFITQYTKFITGGCVDKPGFEYLIGREKWCKIFTLDQYHDHACNHSTTIMLCTFCHSNSCNDNQCCFTKNSSSTEQENSLSKTAELDAVNSNKIALKVNKFMQETCSCALGLKGSPCAKQFSEETVPYNLNTCLELSSGKLDLVILANIQVVNDKKDKAEAHKEQFWFYNAKFNTKEKEFKEKFDLETDNDALYVKQSERENLLDKIVELSSQLNEHKGIKETQNGQSGFVQNVSGESWFPWKQRGRVKQSIIED